MAIPLIALLFCLTWLASATSLFLTPHLMRCEKKAANNAGVGRVVAT